jgi:hypothetical protein
MPLFCDCKNTGPGKRGFVSTHRPAHGRPKHNQKEPFDIHVFMRELKIAVVDLGSIAILAIWLWREAAHALIAK